jgi:hypothetical protein
MGNENIFSFLMDFSPELTLKIARVMKNICNMG